MKGKYSFDYSQHIKHKKEFQYLFEKSFRLYGSFFICRFIFSDNSVSKLGIITSKKFGNAVYRNYIKRIVREAFRHTHFPYSLSIIISQSKPIPHKYKAQKELKKIFSLLTDYYFLLQCSIDPIALKTAQKSNSMSFVAKILFYMILFYRKKISSHLKHSCRYTPSCSVYALEALRVYGFLKGSFFIIKRILSCNPFGGSGYDPLPKNKKKKR